ncbi:MAG: 1-acyl-sn-glycerol-3-phosphate acyltransferase [Oscillibacter sp.]|jgi:1-acyl-sn-glycerol-3-phosphate acyltransferase|nr:1-acyl-sn-glycerol-3-phosphate acyltransferase [Oscillibacter sp.]
MNRFYHFAYAILQPVSRLFHPLRVSGLEHLPLHGALLCPNHCSNWDPVLVELALPVNYRLHIMAKESLFRIPILGWVIRKLGGFPVSRGNSDLQAVKTAIGVIRSGDNLMIFPEGTRVDREGEVRPKGGVAMIGIRTGAVLIPVFIDRDKRLFHPVRIIFGEPYEPVYTGRHGTAEEMQEIADTILRKAYDLGRSPVCG